MPISIKHHKKVSYDHFDLLNYYFPDHGAERIVTVTMTQYTRSALIEPDWDEESAYPGAAQRSPGYAPTENPSPIGPTRRPFAPRAQRSEVWGTRQLHAHSALLSLFYTALDGLGFAESLLKAVPTVLSWNPHSGFQNW